MQGHCLCGAVEVTAPDIGGMAACHCGMCRRWGGGPFMAVHAQSGVSFTGEEHIRAFRSSEWAERGFCSTCGTHLFYRLLPTNEYVLPVGLFQDGPEFRLVQQIFIDRKPASYTFADRTEDLTEAEVFARYAPPS